MSGSLKSWLELLEQRHFKSIDLGLERCGEVYRRLGSPRPAGRVFTVGGTNGKGSVAAYLSAILTAAGQRCGAYTSPHLSRFNERIVIDGVAVSDDELVAALDTVEAARADVSLTYFEFTTLAAFEIFRARRVDTAVLEVGLGGRLDAVNLVDADCAVITRIGLDHQEYLGSDRDAIAFEKAGIMRRGRPVVCSDPEPPGSLRAQAQSVGASLRVIGEDFTLAEEGERDLEFRMDAVVIGLPEPPLAGRHQRENLAAALAALNETCPEVLAKPERVRRALARISLEGRLQAHPRDPRVIVDVGHNPLAAGVVAGFLADRPGRRYCVLAMLRDKDAEGVGRTLAPQVDYWLCAGLEGPRGQSGPALARRLRRAIEGKLSAFERVADALSHAREQAGERDQILVFGSFETAAQALRDLEPGTVHGEAMLIES